MCEEPDRLDALRTFRSSAWPGDVSRPGLIQVVTMDTATPAASLVVDVELPEAVLAEAGCLFPDDPQPEFVDIRGTTAAVALEENDGMAIVDIGRPGSPELVRVFSLGVVAHRPADLTEDGHVRFSETYPADAADEDYAGSRCPDAIAFSPDGTMIYSADEGELVQTLPTGAAPESVVAIPHRNLVVAAAEQSGTITIFKGVPDRYEPSAE